MSVNTRRRRVALSALAGCAAGVGIAWWLDREDAAAPSPTTRPAATPASSVPSATALESLWDGSHPKPDGSTMAMAAYRAQGLILNFWATWCAPCVREFPRLDAFDREHRPMGWRVVGLAIDNEEAVRSFLGKVPVQFDIGVVGGAGLAMVRGLGNTQGGLPFTLVFAPGGHLLDRHLGEVTDAMLRASVAKVR
jgi:thiol-disulfide isomerase/thioredoxin